MRTLRLGSASKPRRHQLVFFLVVANQVIRFGNESRRLELFPQVYAQSTRTNDVLCSLLSAILLRTLRKTYVNQGFQARYIYSTKEIGVFWHCDADNKSVPTMPIIKPIVILMTKRILHDTVSDHVEYIIDAAVDKGWVLVEVELLSPLTCHNSLTRILTCIQADAPIYLFVDIQCSEYLKICSLVINGNRLHGVVALSLGDCFTSNETVDPDSVPCLVLLLADGNNKIDLCSNNPTKIVAHIVPNANLHSQRHAKHSIVIEEEFPEWIARCTVSFMEATTWYENANIDEGTKKPHSRL